MKARKEAKASGKRVAAGDDGPVKKKSRTSKKDTDTSGKGDSGGDNAGAKKKKPRVSKKIAAQKSPK